MGTITIRPMKEEEASLVQKIGKHAFTGIERLMVSKPKKALVAEQDGKITGAVLYKFQKTGGQKIGYIDFAFIDPEYHGQGIGTVLYRAAVDFLWEQGCDALTALVKDDNVGSWSLLLNYGFVRMSLPGLARQFGPAGALKQYFTTPFCFAVGMEYYLALREKPCPSGKGGSAKQLFAFFAANFFLILLTLVSRTQHIGAIFASYYILLIGEVLAGLIGTRFSKRDWKFRHNNGGALTCSLIYLGGSIFPMVGNWYPQRYEKTAEFRRDMGIVAISEWLFVLGLTAFAVFSGYPHTIVRILGQIGAFLLIYRMIPVYPFEAFGGRRVCCWNKWIYAGMTACSLAIVLASFILL